MKKQNLVVLAGSMFLLASCGTPKTHTHDYANEWSTDANQHWYACSGCESKGNLGDHEFGDWSVKVAASYESAGEDHRYCTICNYEEVRASAKLTHNYEQTWSKDANKHWHACTDTGYTSLKKDEANHSFGNWSVKTPATYEAAGVEHRTCSVCSYEETRVLQKLTHHFSQDWSTDANKHWHACTDTGCTEKTDEANHDFGGWSVKTAATYEAAGVEHRTCSVCSYEETRAIDKLTHNYSDQWSKDASGHWHACTDAGYTSLKKDEATHTFGSWEKVSDATFEKKEVQKHTCSVCGYEETQEVGELKAHTYSDQWSSDTEKHWHACTDEGYTSLKSGEAAHTASGWTVQTKPTKSSTGLAVNKCSVCNATMAEYTLPVLNETNYTRTSAVETDGDKKNFNKVSWTLNDTTVITSAVVINEFDPTFKIGGTDYTIESFNTAFDGNMKASFSGSTLVLEVIKEAGYTLTQTIGLKDLSGFDIKLTGYPLTIALAADSDGIGAYYNNLTIDCDLNIVGHSANVDKTAIVADNVVITENADVVVRNIKNVTYLKGTSITINGNLDAAGAINGQNDITLTVANGKKIIVDDVIQAEVPTEYGKHLIVSNDKGDSLDAYITEGLVFASVETEPTTSTKGVINLKNSLTNSGVVITTAEIPALNDTDYTLTPVTVYNSQDKKVYDTTSYRLNDTTYGQVLIEKSAVEVTEYFQAGSSYYSVDTWNALFTNQHSVISEDQGKKIFTMTLSGDQTLFANDGKQGPFDGTLDFSKFDKVVINGTGKLDVTFSNLLDGIVGNSLEIGSGVTMNVTGKSSTDKSGLKFSESITVNGTLNISKFSYAICCADATRNDITVNAGGLIKVTDCGNGIGSWAGGTKVVLNIAGEFNASVNNGAGLLLQNSSQLNVTGQGKLSISGAWHGVEGSGVNAHFTDNSVVSITGCSHNGFNCDGGSKVVFDGNSDVTISATGNALNLWAGFINIGGSSTVDLTAGDNAVVYFIDFIVANVDPSSGTKSQCDASVSIHAGSYGLETLDDGQAGNKGYIMTFYLNSTEDMFVETSYSSKANWLSGINIHWQYCAVYIYSDITFKNFTNGIRNDWSDCQGRVECTGNITLDNTDNVAVTTGGPNSDVFLAAFAD